MLHKITAIVLTMAVCFSAAAKTTITLVYPFAPNHGITPVFYPMLEEANKMQDKYEFVFEPKPGGLGIVALNYMNQNPANRIAVIAPEFIDNIDSGRLVQSDYVHVIGMGDMCMGVFNSGGDERIGFSSLRGTPEIVVGTLGWGNGAHLIGLSVGEKIGIPVRNIIFKSNQEALINLGQGGGVTFVFNRVDAFDSIRAQSKIQAKILGVSCTKRVQSIPHVKTLAEQGITAPAPWVIVTSNKDMPANIRTDIANILNRALTIIGEDRVWELSSLQPLVFSNRKLDDYYTQKVTAQRALLKKFQSAIDADKGTSAK